MIFILSFRLFLIFSSKSSFRFPWSTSFHFPGSFLFPTFFFISQALFSSRSQPLFHFLVTFRFQFSISFSFLLLFRFSFVSALTEFKHIARKIQQWTTYWSYKRSFSQRTRDGHWKRLVVLAGNLAIFSSPFMRSRASTSFQATKYNFQ